MLEHRNISPVSGREPIGSVASPTANLSPVYTGDSFQEGQLFAKIFTQIYNSSIADDWQTRCVFMDMLILADSDGIVDMTPEAISARTRIPLDLVNRSLTSLTSPDPRSRTPDQNGARLVKLDDHRDWGWRIVNYRKYRYIRNEFDRKSYMRSYMRDYREEHKNGACKLGKQTVLTQSNIVNSSPSSSSFTGVQGEESVRDGGKTTVLQERLCRMFKRNKDDRWAYDEEHALSVVLSRPDCLYELNEIERYRAQAGEFFPRSIAKLLEKWTKTLDEARNHVAPKKAETLQTKLSKESVRKTEALCERIRNGQLD